MWSRYGRAVARPDEVASRRMERRLLDRLEASQRASRRPVRALVVAAVVVAAALAILVWARSPKSVADPEPAWVTIAASSRGQEVVLPHEGTLWVAPHSRADVSSSDASGAVVRLHEGEVALSVRSGEGLSWRVEVDAFAVEAIGTRFRVVRTSGVPEVTVDEGVVRLTGPDLPEGGVRIEAADAPVTAARPDAIAPAEATPASPDVAPTPEIARAPTRDAEPDVRDAAREVAKKGPTAPAPAWVARFRDAIDASDDAAAVAALPEAFPTGREALSAADYLDAGDALASQRLRARADAAYAAACRHPGEAACGVATFRRALLAARRGEPDQAIELATRYLDEHPTGSLAREVLGRRMQWTSVHDSMDAARADARAYLDRWPDGPHADLARRLIE